MNHGSHLIGMFVEKIYMDEDTLTFVTDKGMFSFMVEGDCCSSSYFFDFYGVKQLIGNEILTFESVSLSEGDVGYHKETYDTPSDWAEIQVYGFRMTTNHSLFGELTSVFSFRNSSNGYYDGWIEKTNHHLVDEQFRLLNDHIG